MFDWFTVAKLLLTIVNRIFKDLHDRGKINEGRQLQIKDHLQNISQSVGIAKQVEEEINRMSDEEVVISLEGDYRD